MTLERIRSSVVFVALLWITDGVSAAPIIQGTFYATDNYGPNLSSGSAFFGNGFSSLQLLVNFRSADPVESIVVLATQGNTTIQLMEPIGVSGILQNANFNIFLPFDPALMGAWTIRVTDSTGSSDVVAPAIPEPELLPLVENIRISGRRASPTISWDLPDLSDFDVERTRLRVLDADSPRQLFDFIVPTGATAFDLPLGVIEPDKRYVFRVMMQDIEAGRVSNQSSTFSAVFSVPTADGFGIGLMGVAAVCLGTLDRRRRRAR